MITDNKLRQLFELKRSIKILCYEFSAKGLIIDYSLGFISKTIDLDVLETCASLKESGLIQTYDMSNTISWETETNTERNGEHIQECKTIYGSFADFVEQTRFNNFDAATIASLYELRKIKSTNNQKHLI